MTNKVFDKHKNLIWLFLVLCFCGCKQESELEEDNVQFTQQGYSSPVEYPGMTMVWRDEFEGDELDPEHWSHELGGNGWGNNELEFYQEDNTQVRDGYVIITARKEDKEGKNFTSSRIITKGKKEFQYGRVDIRSLLPKGQGIWPALWMLGSNISTVDWPACGEIDIMEMIGGGKDNVLHGTAHWDNAGGHASHGGNVSLKEGKIFADEFHVYSISWTPTSIKWYLDGVQYHEMDITPEELSEFHNSYYFIFNLAVGGNWPGSPDGTTVFPQRLVVDYIRVFQNS
jgi:beta-glucanase (GH16 family)